MLVVISQRDGEVGAMAVRRKSANNESCVRPKMPSHPARMADSLCAVGFLIMRSIESGFHTMDHAQYGYMLIHSMATC